MAAIDGIALGAYATIIQLQGGQTTTLAEYRQSGSTTPITGVMQGAYAGLVQDSDGKFVPLVDHLRNTGGQLIAKTALGGYPALVKSGGSTKTLTAYQSEEEAAISLLRQQTVQPELTDQSS